MGNKNFYEQLRERVGCESKETIWENAKLIYEQCYEKKYLNTFSNQREFAEYLGVTKGRVSQYRYAYEYYLLYQNKIDLRSFSVEQVYTFHRTIGSNLFDFFQWAEDEKNILWEEASLRDTRNLIEEYLNCKKGIKNNNILDSTYEINLTEQEKRIIHLYRNGTDEQRKLINEIIVNA